MGLKYPNDYGNGWQDKWSFSQLPMIPDKWLFKVTESTKEQYDILKNLMNRNDVTEIICATDADREGETIFRACSVSFYVRMFEHNFVVNKEKIRRNTDVLQGFLTQSTAKFAEKTCEKRY